MKNIKLFTIIFTTILSVAMLTGCTSKKEAATSNDEAALAFKTTETDFELPAFQPEITDSSSEELPKTVIVHVDTTDIEYEYEFPDANPIPLEWYNGLSKEEIENYRNEHIKRGCFDVEDLYGTYRAVNTETGEYTVYTLQIDRMNKVKNRIVFDKEFIDSMDTFEFNKETGICSCSRQVIENGALATYSYKFDFWEQDGEKFCGLSCELDATSKGTHVFSGSSYLRRID